MNENTESSFRRWVSTSKVSGRRSTLRVPSSSSNHCSLASFSSLERRLTITNECKSMHASDWLLWSYQQPNFHSAHLGIIKVILLQLLKRRKKCCHLQGLQKMSLHNQHCNVSMCNSCKCRTYQVKTN